MAARTLDLHPGRTRLVGQILPLAAMILRSVRSTTRLLGSRQRLATPGLLTQDDYVVAAGAGTFTMIKLVLLLPLLLLLVLVVVLVAMQL